MEGRIRSLLLGCIYSYLALMSIPTHAEELEVEQVNKPVIQPNIERMTFEESKINPDNFEIILSFGILSIEDFGANTFTGAKLAYRASENFFVDLELGTSTAGITSFEVTSDAPLMPNEDRDYSFYTVNLGYDIFPGESFVTRNTTLNTAFYVIAGAGNTQFAGGDNFTISFGFGYRVIASKYFTAYFDVRDHTFDLDIIGVDKNTTNIEMSLGVGVYF